MAARHWPRSWPRLSNSFKPFETLQTSNATVVKAPLRAPQVSPRPIRNGLFGLAFGVIIGLGLALLVDALDTRVRSGDEIAARLGIPLLGRLPEPPKKVRERQKLVMLAEPHGRQAEAFRMLRTNLELANIDEDVKIIAVASALPSEGKSTTVANLAVAAARGGQRVALVDLDLRKPMLATFFEGAGPWGVIDVALGRVSLADALLRMNVAAFLDDDGHDVRELRPDSTSCSPAGCHRTPGNSFRAGGLPTSSRSCAQTTTLFLLTRRPCSASATRSHSLRSSMLSCWSPICH